MKWIGYLLGITDDKYLNKKMAGPINGKKKKTSSREKAMKNKVAENK